MSTTTHDRLDQLQMRCERLLDDSLSIQAFMRDIVDAVIETEELTAAAFIELKSPTDHRVLVGSGLEAISLDNFFSFDPDHVTLLIETIQEQKTKLAIDRSIPEFGLHSHSIAMTPLPGKEPPFILFELFTLEQPDAEQAAHLKQVSETVVNYTLRYAQEQGNKVPALTTDFWKQFDIYLLKLQQSLDTKQTAYVAVNDGRTLIGCERVSIALKHGTETKMIAVSGQESVQHRANLVKAMAKVCDEVITLGVPVTYRGVVDDLPPSLEAPLADYLAESRTRMVMLIPIHESVDIIKDDMEIAGDIKPEEKRIMGCLVVEQATESRPKPVVIERTELLKEHIETAINNCQKYETIFLLPVWRNIGRAIRWFKGRRIWIASAIAAACVLVSLALWLVPWTYRVEGAGQAMPVVQHEVFAPWDGDVVDVTVESGQRVKAGDTLLIIESDELDAEFIATETELLEKQKHVLSLSQQYRAVSNGGSSIEDEVRVQGELVKTRVEVQGIEKRLKKIKSRLQKLTVTAPADGVVATFQVKQLLENRPVRRGEVLIEVMEPDGPWRLELEVPEYRMGHVLDALKKENGKQLKVEYVLATQVESSYDGTMTQIASRSNQSEEAGTIFEVYADINKDELPGLSIGADVTAKIDCGRKSLFYVLFGDVVEFVQRMLWL